MFERFEAGMNEFDGVRLRSVGGFRLFAEMFVPFDVLCTPLDALFPALDAVRGAGSRGGAEEVAGVWVAGEVGAGSGDIFCAL